MRYKDYKRYDIDISPLGVMQIEDAIPYFCTPKRERIIGWSGVDGIHYCFAHGFGEMVFAVSPMNSPGEYVHPIARNFGDFLRLLLACGDAAALEQAWAWDESQFDSFLSENPLADKQTAVLETLKQKFRLTPLEHPFAYIKELQAEFDYSRIQYTDYYDDFIPPEPTLPPWKVYFEDDFWDRRGKSRAGTELPIQTRFIWDGQEVYVPSVYSCAKGLVADICVKVSPEEIRTFMDDWDLSPEHEGSDFTDEQRMQAKAENPIVILFTSEVTVNGKILCFSHGSIISWNPCDPYGNGIESKGVLEHYGLDPDFGWVISRHAFPWATSRRPKELDTISITLKANATQLPGPTFQADSAGEQIAFIHPISGKRHTLTVLECEKQELPEHAFHDDTFEYPTHYTVMSYTITPDLPDDAFSIIDSGQGDSPKKRQIGPNGPDADSFAMLVGIIGGADGPTAIFVGGKTHAACSSLHFSSDYDVEWRIIFQEKMRSDVTATLI